MIYNYLDLLNLDKSGILFMRHESLSMVYISRKLHPDEYPILPYQGKLGRGFKVLLPNWNSTRYSRVQYFIYR